MQYIPLSPWVGFVHYTHGANVLCLVHTPDISPDKLNFCTLEKDGEQSNVFVHVCYTVRPLQTMQVRAASISVVIVIITAVDNNDDDDDSVVPKYIGYSLRYYSVHIRTKTKKRP